MSLVGRCAALSVAAEARRRHRARRDTQDTPQQPLSDFLAAETAHLAATTPDDRAVTLEALREHGDPDERLASRRRELRRR